MQNCMKPCKAKVMEGGYNVTSINRLPPVGRGIRLCLQCYEANKFCYRLLNKFLCPTSQFYVGGDAFLHYTPDIRYGKEGICGSLIGHFLKLDESRK